MPSEKETYETFDLPGVGEFRARTGTATAELAGAAKYWFDRFQGAYHEGRKRGAVAASIAIVSLELVTAALYFLMR